MKILLTIISILICGCLKTPDALFVEGTRTTIGLYIPYGGSLYGIQFLEYLNGTVLLMNDSTNVSPISISREHNATNEYFSLVETKEKTKTEIEIK